MYRWLLLAAQRILVRHVGAGEPANVGDGGRIVETVGRAIVAAEVNRGGEF